MSVNYITMERRHKVARPIASEEEYRQIRNSQQQLANLKAVREQGDTKAKNRLAQFNYSGHYPDGKLKGNRLPSGAFPFDCDEREEFERIAPILLQDPDRYGLLMLERSARQGGHAVFVRERGKTILENQVRIATLLRTELDTSAHDINRVLFATSASADDLLYLSPKLFEDTYDETAVAEEARLLEERERNGMEELPEGAHKANKHFRPWEGENLKLEIKKEEGESKNLKLKIKKEEEPQDEADTQDFPLSYCGLPYSEIIATWWELYNDGQEPVTSNRDVMTFELAVNLRHICGFDRQLLDRVIPCYDGFPEEQKLKCIDSALAERRTQMPKRLRDVLQSVRQDNLEDESLLSVLDEVEQHDNHFFYNQLKGLPLGVKDSVDAVAPALAMPALVTICPAIGMLASGVQLDVHGQVNTLNLISFVAGDFASGKGSLDPLVSAWIAEVRAQDKLYLMAEEEFRVKKRAAKNKKDQPEEPKLPVRILTLNNTVANLAERLANTEGKTAFSFTPEADTMAQKLRSSMTDYSVMLRQAYDGSSFSREARSLDAVNVHIDHLRWNVVMVGTPDALYRVLNNNYTDGFQSRIAVAKAPDNTFTPLADRPYRLTELQEDHIHQVAHLLPLMSGEVKLPKLENQGREWLESIRIESMKDDDKVKARQRFRVCVTAQRMVCCLMLCQVAEKLIKNHGLAGAERRLKENPNLWSDMMVKAQTVSLLNTFNVIADSLLDTNLYYFREKIEGAYRQISTGRKGVNSRYRNGTIYERLASPFTFEQALQQAVACKGSDTTRNSVHQMLKNWRNQGLVKVVEKGTYQKTNS